MRRRGRQSRNPRPPRLPFPHRNAFLRVSTSHIACYLLHDTLCAIASMGEPRKPRNRHGFCGFCADVLGVLDALIRLTITCTLTFTSSTPPFNVSGLPGANPELPMRTASSATTATATGTIRGAFVYARIALSGRASLSAFTNCFVFSTSRSFSSYLSNDGSYRHQTSIFLADLVEWALGSAGALFCGYAVTTPSTPNVYRLHR